MAHLLKNFKCEKCNYEKEEIVLSPTAVKLGHVWCPNCKEKYWLTNIPNKK